ncbi:hypothetical protein Cni_G22639 [Canna indica]|uniref:AP2/ERF domain-containing protein n=1 Tax=Canna indica TaxID=4628 RepID=A0AAQ3QJR6_9LILI|nr:hypothetical protein Cni_G22639 [Canna indica]
MDLELDSSDNWLAFSLSQHHQRCLLQAFSSAPHGGGENRVQEETNAATELVALAGMEPKLEDFLGLPLGRYPGGDYDHTGAEAAYDCKQKTVAAGRYLGEQLEPPPPPPQATTNHAAPPSEEPRKMAPDNFGQRTSIYRGVTRHRWTGRYEAHLWDNSCRREGQSRKGRQGGYDKEDKAARAYDLAALKYWGPTTTTNFPISNYEKELEEMKNMTRQEFIASLRRKSSGFSRGASMYRGVTRHHQHGRWQARIGRVAGNKDLYLGTFSTQEEAAEAYDIAAIKFRGLNAVTNFDMSRYDVESIINSDLPVGGLSGCRQSKTAAAAAAAALESSSPPSTSSSSETICIDFKNHQNHDYWSLLALHHQQLQQQQQQQQQGHESGFSLFSDSGVSMDFGNASANNVIGHESGNIAGHVWNNGIMMVDEQQEQPQISSSYSLHSLCDPHFAWRW